MNDSMASSISILEDFPDELFYDILDYLSVDDLYDGFYDLNTRFRSILLSLTNIYGEITTNEQVHSPAFHLFASRITSLKLNAVDTIDLSSFPAIRSLTLKSEPNRNQCKLIQRLSYLEYLYVSRGSGEHFYYSFSLPFYVFTNVLPNLRICQLNLILYKDDQQWTSVPSLHTLSIGVGDPRVYNQILRSCPALVHLKIEFTKHFVKLPETYQNSFHSSLRQFDLYLNRTTLSCCQIIDWMLSVVPNLTHFHVRGSPSEANIIDIGWLAAILHHRLSKLRQFYLEMAIVEFLAPHLSDNEKQRTQTLHPVFNSIQMHPSTENAPARLIIA